MRVEIDLATARRVATKLVDANPTNTNNGVCRYARRTEGDVLVPNCIVGCIMNRFGVDVYDLARWDDCDDSSVSDILPRLNPMAWGDSPQEGFDYDIVVEHDALVWLASLQGYADREYSADPETLKKFGTRPWREALDLASA